MKKQIQPPASNNKTKLDNSDIQKQQQNAKQLEQERIEAIQKRRRAIYEAICALIDPVAVEEMLDQLKVLDVHAWAEVVEERFLGRLCGYPVCSKNIKVDFRRKYVLLRRETRREFVSVDSEPYKFCSDRCMCMARAVAGQLGTEEQSLAMLRLVKPAKPKQFQLPTGDEWKQFLELDQDDDEEE